MKQSHYGRGIKRSIAAWSWHGQLIAAGNLTITSTSGLSRSGRTHSDRYQSVHGDECPNEDGRRNFWSYEPPLSWHVNLKEKLREAHVSNPGASGGQPSNQAVDLLASDKDSDHCGSPEILCDLISCHINVVVRLNVSMLGCLSHSQGPSNMRDSASLPGSCTKPPVIKHFHARTTKPRLLMGPRSLNLAPALGSVTDRVRVLE